MKKILRQVIKLDEEKYSNWKFEKQKMDLNFHKISQLTFDKFMPKKPTILAKSKNP